MIPDPDGKRWGHRGNCGSSSGVNPRGVGASLGALAAHDPTIPRRPGAANTHGRNMRGDFLPVNCTVSACVILLYCYNGRHRVAARINRETEMPTIAITQADLDAYHAAVMANPRGRLLERQAAAVDRIRASKGFIAHRFATAY